MGQYIECLLDFKMRSFGIEIENYCFEIIKWKKKFIKNCVVIILRGKEIII